MIELNRILCPIDFSEYSEHALDFAVRMAAWYGSTVHVVHVMPLLPPSTVSALGEASRQLANDHLALAVGRCARGAVPMEKELLESGDVAGRILDRADAIDADLIVTGSHGRTGLTRAVLGSVVESLLHRSRRPMLVVPSHLAKSRVARPVNFSRIVCAVDFSVASLSAAAYALSIAEEAEAQLTLLNVIEKPPELDHSPLEPDFDIERFHAEAEARQRTKLQALIPDHAEDYCTVRTAVVEGSASRQVLRLAAEQNADLIVLGVHGRNAVDLAIFGSNSKDVVVKAQCPVLVIPAGRRSSMRAAS
jgi:nucleotide-binding universal stress UspA family protein